MALLLCCLTAASALRKTQLSPYPCDPHLPSMHSIPTLQGTTPRKTLHSWTTDTWTTPPTPMLTAMGCLGVSLGDQPYGTHSTPALNLGKKTGLCTAHSGRNVFPAVSRPLGSVNYVQSCPRPGEHCSRGGGGGGVTGAPFPAPPPPPSPLAPKGLL